MWIFDIFYWTNTYINLNNLCCFFSVALWVASIDLGNELMYIFSKQTGHQPSLSFIEREKNIFLWANSDSVMDNIMVALIAQSDLWFYLSFWISDQNLMLGSWDIWKRKWFFASSILFLSASCKIWTCDVSWVHLVKQKKRK